MTVSATLACLNVSMYQLDKSFRSTSMPKPIPGYGTDVTKVSHYFGKESFSCAIYWCFHPGLISKIIMIFFKNSFIKKYYIVGKEGDTPLF